MRLKIIRLITVVFFMMIALNLFYMQVIRGPYYFNLSVNNRIRVIPLDSRRGIILDRNGMVLADNRMAFNVEVIPQDIRDLPELFEFLSKILKTDKEKLSRKFYEKKLAPFSPVVIAQDVSKQEAMVIEENRYHFPGLYIQEVFLRNYPFGENGAHVLGYIGRISDDRFEQLKEYGYTYQSIIGYSGVEEYYDPYLKGEEGGLQVEVNSRGQQVRLLGIRQPQKGQDLRLTIDQRVQDIAANLLQDRQGTIMVMNLDSGAMMGMVSSPAYDPNVFVNSELKNKAGLIFTNPQAPLLNRAIKGLYPPGSVFKPMVAIAALMAQKITTQTSFDCHGAHVLGRRSFQCAHVHGWQDLLQGLMHSCNVYFFNVGERAGPDLMAKYARIFGLGSLTHIDLPFEAKGTVPGPLERKLKKNEGWYKGDTLNMAIGQGDTLVTPLQLLRMMAIIARDGRDIQPFLIQSVGEQSIINSSSANNIVLPQEIFNLLHKGLRSAVADATGTAHILNMKDFEVYGKTGTAQSSPGRDHHAWFVGYNFKGKEPIAFCVFLEYGGSSYNACAVAREMLLAMREKDII